MVVEVGTAIPPWRVAGVDPEKMKTMSALLRDPNPIHFDPDAGRALGFDGRVVNQGPTNVGYVVNMLLAWTGDPAALQRVSVRFIGNVFGGDTVEAGGAVTELKSVGGVVIAVCDVWLDRSDGTRLLSGTADVVVS